MELKLDPEVAQLYCGYCEKRTMRSGLSLQLDCEYRH